jgi:hypothetical protein
MPPPVNCPVCAAKEATVRQVCVLEDHGGAGPSRTNRGTHPDRHRCGQQQNKERVRLGVAGLSQHWKDDQIALLGTAPDCQLARNLKKSASAISQKRDRLGIPPFNPSNGRTRRSPYLERPVIAKSVPDWGLAPLASNPSANHKIPAYR